MKYSTLLVTCVAFATISGVAGPAFADDPRHFLQNALEADNTEIMLGGLAADRARSPRVQDYGRMLASDHHDAREEVLRIGERMGVRRSRDLAPGAKEERDRLQGLDGRDFDREFIRYMIEDHTKDVAEFRNEARENHGAVSDLASRQLPTLQKHLDMAMDLDRAGDRRGMERGPRDDQRHNEDSYRYSDGNRDGQNNQQPNSGSYNDRNNPNR